MLIPFNTTRVAQASAVLLKQHANRMSRMRLLKMLYIADRECIAQTGRPISGDRAVAMKNGPVLSRTYDLIKGEDFQAPTWSKFIENVGRIDVALRSDPGVGLLSKHEIAKLQEIARRFEESDDWEVANYTHQFEEWKKHEPEGNGQNPIPLDDVLAATGMQQFKESLLQESSATARFDQLLARVPHLAKPKPPATQA